MSDKVECLGCSNLVPSGRWMRGECGEGQMGRRSRAKEASTYCGAGGGVGRAKIIKRQTEGGWGGCTGNEHPAGWSVR